MVGRHALPVGPAGAGGAAASCLTGPLAPSEYRPETAQQCSATPKQHQAHEAAQVKGLCNHACRWHCVCSSTELSLLSRLLPVGVDACVVAVCVAQEAGQAKGGYIAGDKLSFADLAVFHTMSGFISGTLDGESWHVARGND